MPGLLFLRPFRRNIRDTTKVQTWSRAHKRPQYSLLDRPGRGPGRRAGFGYSGQDTLIHIRWAADDPRRTNSLHRGHVLSFIPLMRRKLEFTQHNKDRDTIPIRPVLENHNAIKVHANNSRLPGQYPSPKKKFRLRSFVSAKENAEESIHWLRVNAGAPARAVASDAERGGVGGPMGDEGEPALEQAGALDMAVAAAPRASRINAGVAKRIGWVVDYGLWKESARRERRIIWGAVLGLGGVRGSGERDGGTKGWRPSTPETHGVLVAYDH
ncbi:hypothetical protein DFH07DRAFT_976891 [Mycena maculata]|uniref:Uncharacterized protein n=1 Tax=Mycena maculata TaxID=230809 RepID=A0AAD7K893_9AGAR|nr:hypothetical protein DFH07DRAFT_976891 [Mycena maculata]